MKGNYSDTMRTAIQNGGIPGDGRGPEWARGCSKCAFGIVSQPNLFNLGVPNGNMPNGVIPLRIARAMALDMDGVCYIVFCDCRVGRAALRGAQREHKRMQEASRSPIPQTISDGSRNTWTVTNPPDVIPGQWWARVRAACEQMVAQVEREEVEEREPEAVPVLEGV